MLLHSHVSSSAREEILPRIWGCALAKLDEVYAPERSRLPDPQVRYHVDAMVAKLVDIEVVAKGQAAAEVSSDETSPHVPLDTALVLCAPDIMTVLDTLYPKPTQSSTPFDPFLSSSATAFAAQYSQTHNSLGNSSQNVFDTGVLPSGTRTPTLSTGSGLMHPIGSRPRTSRTLRNSTSSQFEHLRRELPLCVGSRPVHLSVFDEQWSLFVVGPDGNVSVPTAPTLLDRWRSEELQDSALREGLAHFSGRNIPSDVVQKAAMKLTDQHRGYISSPGSNSSIGGGLHNGQPLERRFEIEIEYARNEADISSEHYWWNALKGLRKHYPLAIWSQDDTRILHPIMVASQVVKAKLEQSSLDLENSFIELKNTFDRLKDAIGDLYARLERLRNKMWYLMDVTHSDIYENARNIARALNNMTTERSSATQPDQQNRGRVYARSVSGSLLQRRHTETTGVMKASSEHGGPKKLADEQVDATKKWLQRNAIDNFCKGEERIHRFCMEMRLAMRKLVAETMNESPVLWSSDLFHRERTMFDNPNMKPSAGSNQTRPPSITTDDFPTTYQYFQYGQRSLDTGPRMYLLETQSSPGRKSSFHSTGSSRVARDLYGNDASSMGGSPGRATSATTTDSVSSVWSRSANQAQSMTSISSHSRPESTYNDTASAKVADQTAHAKTAFLESLRQSLMSLLLSDLGCPVWSCGSETDAWLESVMKQREVGHRVENRRDIEHLLSNPSNPHKSRLPPSTKMRSSNQRRSMSANSSPIQHQRRSSGSSTPTADHFTRMTELSPTDSAWSLKGYFPYSEAYRQITDKFCSQSNPVLKLEALHELKKLAISQMKEKASHDTFLNNAKSQQKGLGAMSQPASRRTSLNPSSFSNGQEQKTGLGSDETLPQPGNGTPSEAEIVENLKRILLETKPRTLFRDLQYISAFVPPEILNNTEKGQAFLHAGLAALAYKDDVCRSLVDVADKIITTDTVKRRAGVPISGASPLNEAALYLTVAAMEGNAVAQRELASLYLTHAVILPVASLPLSLPRETFRSEMMYWREDGSGEPNLQAMCLALHWMQAAANNGDEIARSKLKEREGLSSIR